MKLDILLSSRNSLPSVVNLKKVFDTVDHEIAIFKLNFYGIRGIPLAWLTTYLAHRQQFVIIHDHVSTYKPVVCGVSQGSVLFLLYMNYLFQISKFL